MQIYSPENSADQNLEILAANEYPGRFLVQGFVGKVGVQAYAIEGRSTGSQNRVLVEEAGVVSTDLFDKNQSVGNPELTIYDAMDYYKAVHVVSNGRQTDTAIDYLVDGNPFEAAMRRHTFEPDVPNFTPRISGFLNLNTREGEDRLGISLIRRVRNSGTLPMHDFFADKTTAKPLELEDGTGYAIHTYKSNAQEGEPLPSFDEQPFRIPILGNAQEMTEMLYATLKPDNLVAVATKTIDGESGKTDIHIKNKHEQV